MNAARRCVRLLPLRALLALGLAAAASLPAACGERAPFQPHIVVVVCDALRADHLELYGYGRTTAPKLAAWAAEGLVFDRATAASNWTRPSVQALFTGREPVPGLLLAPDEMLPPEAATLAERLALAGYETAAVSANPFVSTALGAARGFQGFVDLGWKGSERSGHWKDDIASPFVLDRVEYLLSSRARSGKPVFLYVHLMDTHLPYDPPSSCGAGPIRPTPGPSTAAARANRGLPAADAEHPLPAGRPRAGRGPLRREIARLDRGLERLRELVAEHLKDRPVVTVVTADHGEAFGEPPLGVYTHGRGLGPELLRVPLIMHGVRPEGRVAARVGLIDLGPRSRSSAAPRSGRTSTGTR
jgi:arylsulfatase A-like enzyme